MTVKPLYDRVLIKMLEAEEKTVGGIVLASSAKEKPQVAEVIAVGEGKKHKDGSISPLTVKAGDKVITSKYSGTEVKLDGEEYIIVAESDILAIVD